jgi:hypothetical protein
MSRIAAMWRGFMQAAQLDRPECPAIQREEMEKAFWAGAAAMFYGMKKIAGDDDGEPTEIELGIMNDLDEELRAYFTPKEEG